MFGLANPKKQQITTDEMRGVYETGKLEDSPRGDALGNAMAAILIGEAHRDYLVIPENDMLMALGIAPALIIGGHCVPKADSCQNGRDKMDGRHPIAWGGAQQFMMSGGWGHDNGATSDVGQQFETKLIVDWLTQKNRNVTAAQSQLCSGPNGFTDFNLLAAEQKSTLRNLFTGVLPKFKS